LFCCLRRVGRVDSQQASWDDFNGNEADELEQR
jgi:hypothetical protein